VPTGDSFSARVKRLLNERVLTQREFAKLLGVQPSSVFNTLKLSNPIKRTIRRYAEVLGVEPEELLPREVSHE
jgi:transcriptional regulator with XRE-family HTH domain